MANGPLSILIDLVKKKLDDNSSICIVTFLIIGVTLACFRNVRNTLNYDVSINKASYWYTYMCIDEIFKRRGPINSTLADLSMSRDLNILRTALSSIC